MFSQLDFTGETTKGIYVWPHLVTNCGRKHLNWPIPHVGCARYFHLFCFTQWVTPLFDGKSQWDGNSIFFRGGVCCTSLCNWCENVIIVGAFLVKRRRSNLPKHCQKRIKFPILPFVEWVRGSGIYWNQRINTIIFPRGGVPCKRMCNCAYILRNNFWQEKPLTLLYSSMFSDGWNGYWKISSVQLMYSDAA